MENTSQLQHDFLGSSVNQNDSVIKESSVGTTMRTVIITYTSETRGGRYVICDAQTKAVIDDAQGFGFKTREKAVNYATAHGWRLAYFTPNYPITPPLFIKSKKQVHRCTDK